MAITTTCPACRGPLRIPDELVGQRVRCPTCQNVFEAATDAPPPPPSPPAPQSDPEPERPLWKDLSLDLDKTDPARPKDPAPELEPTPTAPPPRKGLVGAVEMKLSIDDEPAAPPRPAPASRSSAPPRRPEPPRSRRPPGGPAPRDNPERDEDDEDYRGSRRPYIRRRDTEPHRGALILVLGIISLVCVFISWCYGIGVLIGIPLGITSWVLGHNDLRKIKNQEMDDEGQGMTQAGWICGIIGTLLNTLVLLACGGFLAFILYSASTSQSTATKPAFAPPPPAVKQ